MSLKRKIDKETYEKLNAEIKAIYRASGDDYLLDAEDDSEPSAELKRAKDREAQNARDEKKRADALQAQIDELTGNDARKRGDIETLEKSWKEKLENTTKEFTTKLSTRDSFIRDTLVDSVAQKLASEISNAPAVLLPHIKARITADLDGETPTTKILDAQGKPSALTVDDLRKEFVANKDFSSIIVASKASGSAAKANDKPASRAADSQVDKPTLLSKVSPTELAERIKAKMENATQTD